MSFWEVLVISGVVLVVGFLILAIIVGRDE